MSFFCDFKEGVRKKVNDLPLDSNIVLLNVMGLVWIKGFVWFSIWDECRRLPDGAKCHIPFGSMELNIKPNICPIVL